MRATDIKVGGVYTAKVGDAIGPVRVEAIRSVECWVGLAGSGKKAQQSRYDVTDLRTSRKTTFYSAMKFRRVATPADFVGIKSAASESDRCASCDIMVPVRGRQRLMEAHYRPGTIDTCPGSGTSLAARQNGQTFSEEMAAYKPPTNTGST